MVYWNYYIFSFICLICNSFWITTQLFKSWLIEGAYTENRCVGLHFYFIPSPNLPMPYPHFSAPYTNNRFLCFPVCGAFFHSKLALPHFCDLNLCANSSRRHSHAPSERAHHPQTLPFPVLCLVFLQSTL